MEVVNIFELCGGVAGEGVVSLKGQVCSNAAQARPQSGGDFLGGVGKSGV